MLVAVLVAAACETGPPPPAQTSPSPASRTAPAATIPAPTPTPILTPAIDLSSCERFGGGEGCVRQAIEEIDLDRMREHMRALAGFGSRDPRHPGHAEAIAYITEQLEALADLGVEVTEHRAVHQGIPLTNILVTIDPAPGTSATFGARETLPPIGATGWILIATHYDSTAVRTPGWRPAIDPAPGADDNATGTAALLEYARVLAEQRDERYLRRRVVLAFFDGEELFFRGSAAYLGSLPEPYPYSHVVNIDMVGFNPIADRLDLIWYGPGSDGLRDRVKDVNERYETGLQLVEVFANDPGEYILDTAPFGLAGIPSVTLAERYGPPDGTYPGNDFFHTVNDTPDKVTNERLWLKAARLTLATALELARFE